MDKVAFIILNWNGWDDTVRCLESIQTSEHLKHSIIIVDNGSTDDSVPSIIKWTTDELGLKKICQEYCIVNGYRTMAYHFSGVFSLTLLALDENIGGSGGRNVGIHWALLDETVDYLFFLDNDARIEPATISVCITMATEAKAAIVGCLIKNEDGTTQFAGADFCQNIFYLNRLLRRSFYQESKENWEIDIVSSCGMLVTRNMLEELRNELGYFFNPKFFHWSEDQEFCLQVKRFGKKVVLARDALVYHKITQGGAGLHTAYYYSSRNRMFLANEFLPLGLKILFNLYYPLYRLMRAFIDLMRGNSAVSFAHLEGLIDSYKGLGGKWKKQC